MPLLQGHLDLHRCRGRRGVDYYDYICRYLPIFLWFIGYSFMYGDLNDNRRKYCDLLNDV
jgi:hypothetical protein